jgi:hypothetical protein
MKHYTVKHEQSPAIAGPWDLSPWSAAETAHVDWFHPRSSDHRPVTDMRMLHDADALYVRFRVQDRFVRAVTTTYQGPTCRDSCVEFFLEPLPGRGYFNFEFNCIGAALLYFVEDPTIIDGRFARFTPVPADLFSQVTVGPALAGPISTEIPGPLEWSIGCRVPWSVFESYLGPLGAQSGKTWRGNFYKCASELSHPHWAAWSPVGDQLNFHQPARFGTIDFGM